MGKRERTVLWGERGRDEGVGGKKMARGNKWFEVVEERDRERQREERWENIERLRYNRWYGLVKGTGIPEYLKKVWGESRGRRIAKCRLENEMKEKRYWEEEGKRECRMCEGEEETWEHVWDECGTWKERRGESCQKVYKRILGVEGEGEGWMREVEEERKR